MRPRPPSVDEPPAACSTIQLPPPPANIDRNPVICQMDVVKLVGREGEVAEGASGAVAADRGRTTRPFARRIARTNPGATAEVPGTNHHTVRNRLPPGRHRAPRMPPRVRRGRHRLRREALPVAAPPFGCRCRTRRPVEPGRTGRSTLGAGPGPTLVRRYRPRPPRPESVRGSRASGRCSGPRASPRPARSPWRLHPDGR
jgi:hypothetical protein